MKDSPKLPRLLFVFFQWYCKSERFEELHGDLEELYIDRLEEVGKTRALLFYAWDVMRCCQPYAWKKLKSQTNLNKVDMFKNHLLIAVRHLLRRKGYAALNIFGLSLGMVASLVILLYLNQELSYDNYHKDAELVHRISTHFTETDGTTDNWASTQRPLGKTVKETFAEVDQYVRFMPVRSTRMERNNVNYLIEDVYLVDSTVFDVFSFEFVQGSPAIALNEPNSICLSESQAYRIFKGTNPMGEILKTDDYTLKVSGVYKDQPKHSHLIANAMVSSNTNPEMHRSQVWGGWGIYTYIKLNAPESADAVEDRLNTQIVDQYIEPIFGDNLKVVYELQAIQDIHLYSEFESEPSSLGSIEYVYIFAVVALFLIIIASINYMNLATAQSMKRALEVGVRKTMGANRGSLINQFIAESVVITSISLLLSILILVFVVPVINTQIGTTLDINQLLKIEVMAIVALILVVTGILSGSYPAFYLSAFSPSRALRGGNAAKRTGNSWLRRGLVGLQFAISIFMLISTFIIYDQMQFLQSKDLGFDKNQVMTLRLRSEALEQWEVLKNRLLQNPDISEVANASSVPSGGYANYTRPIENNKGVMESLGLNTLYVDYDYFSVLGVDMVAGRDFSKEFSTETSHAVIVNEAMVRRLGWEEAIGKRIHIGFDSVVQQVVGVARDFHQSSLYDPIEPLVFVPNQPNRRRRAMIRIDDNYRETINFVSQTWNDLFPNLPLESQFLDQHFVELYENDQIRGNLFLGFSIIMIVIAALGLLGLASFMAEQRSKEISIRKVLGASIRGLISLLVREFVILVLVGAVPAFVGAYLFAENWLSEFEYHVSINFMIFALVVFIIMAVTISTTGFHAFQAARANPSENLKSE